MLACCNGVSGITLRYSQCAIPLGTRRNNNVIVTSKRRRDVVLTSSWRYYCVVYPLGMCHVTLVVITWTVGVTKQIVSVPLISPFFDCMKTLFTFWIPRRYLTGVARAYVRWHVTNMTVIQRGSNFYSYEIKIFCRGEINEQTFSNHHCRCLVFNLNHRNSIEDRKSSQHWTPLDEIYGSPIFKRIADTWSHGTVPKYQSPAISCMPHWRNGFLIFFHTYSFNLASSAEMWVFHENEWFFWLQNAISVG